jgi:hypothetical protein
VRRRKVLLSIAAGALAADLFWLGALFLRPPRHTSDVAHYVMPATARSVELTLACGATGGWIDGGRSDVGDLLLLEHDWEGAKIADCVRHRSGGTISPRLNIPPHQ